MPREKKQRIATEAAPAAFANPFAILDLPGRELPTEGRDRLPPGPPPSSRPSEPLGPTLKGERLLLRRSTAHRGGKTVLVLEGFSPAWTNPKLEALLHDLKASLGCGGTLKDRALELQGDQPDRLIPLLESHGFTIKRGW